MQRLNFIFYLLITNCSIKVLEGTREQNENLMNTKCILHPKCMAPRAPAFLV